MKTIKCKFYGNGYNPETDENDIPGCCTAYDCAVPCEVNPERIKACERNIEDELIAKEYDLEDY